MGIDSSALFSTPPDRVKSLSDSRFNCIFIGLADRKTVCYDHVRRKNRSNCIAAVFCFTGALKWKVIKEIGFAKRSVKELIFRLKASKQGLQ
jgi:hypothetical protein